MNFKEELFIYGSRIWKMFEVILTDILKKYSISINEGLILLFISRNKNITVNDIVNIFNYNQGNTSSICKKLDNDGLIKRIRNSSDERIVNLSLTDNGFNIVNKIYKEIEVRINDIKNKFGQDKLNSIVNGMSNLDEVLNYAIKGENYVRN